MRKISGIKLEKQRKILMRELVRMHGDFIEKVAREGEHPYVFSGTKYSQSVEEYLINTISGLGLMPPDYPDKLHQKWMTTHLNLGYTSNWKARFDIGYVAEESENNPLLKALRQEGLLLSDTIVHFTGKALDTKSVFSQKNVSKIEEHLKNENAPKIVVITGNLIMVDATNKNYLIDLASEYPNKLDIRSIGETPFFPATTIVGPDGKSSKYNSWQIPYEEHEVIRSSVTQNSVFH